VSAGVKLDSGKDPWDLLPLRALTEVVRALGHGARKYGRWNWRKVSRLQERYQAAAMRHVVSAQLGEVRDSESGLPHLAHAICCLLFKLEDTLQHESKNSTKLGAWNVARGKRAQESAAPARSNGASAGTDSDARGGSGGDV
jgi:hypothetical protein